MGAEFFCGIDMGSLNSLSYVAFLYKRRFFLDLYQPSCDNPLPLSIFNNPIACYAIDAPQGLPSKNNKRRLCDKEAKTPTSVLPVDLASLETWKLYGGLVRCGISIFWSIHERKIGKILGLDGPDDVPIIVETYPRKTALQLGLSHLPSKRKDPLAYVDYIWSFLKRHGYQCDSVVRPCVDHIDAMLCAIAAEAATGIDTFVKLGREPQIDIHEPVLREGFIVCPAINGGLSTHI